MTQSISVSVKVAVRRNEEILLLSYDDDGDFHYNLPGGRGRPGEPLRDTVRRKVFEETGITVAPGRLLFVVEYVPELWNNEFGDYQKVQFQFEARPVGDTTPRFSDPRDPMQVGFEWVRIDKVESKYLLPRVSGQLVRALTQERDDVFVDHW